MSKKNSRFKITNEQKKVSIGVFLCIFSIYLSLNLVEVFEYDFLIYPSRIINYVVSFFIGSIFAYFLYFFLFIYGLTLILYKKKIRLKKWLFILGLVLFFVGGIIITTNSLVENYISSLSSIKQSYLTFDNFESIYRSTVLSFDSSNPFKVDLIYSFGTIGMILCAFINQFLTSIGSYAIGAVLFSSGIIILLIKPVIYCYKKFIEFKNYNYKLSSSSKYTKDKDITITTTISPIFDEGDSIDIETPRVNNDIYYNEDNNIDDNETNNDDFEDVYPKNDNSFFNDEPATRAVFSFNEEKNEEINDNFENNNVKFEDDSFINNNSFKKEETFQNNESISEINKKYVEGNSINYVKPTFDYENKEEIKKETKPKFKRRNKYIAPSLTLLENRPTHETEQKNKEVAEERTEIINNKLEDLGVKARVVSFKIGPSVTRYDIQTERNVSIKGFNAYINDICIELGGVSARFSPIVLGKTTSGLEIANATCSTVNFKDCLQALNRLPKAKLTNIPFGKDINNELLTVDLQELPHLLVSGSTGSGKSIFIHSIIMTLIMRNSPDNLKLVLIDPKYVELTKYRNIPHLMCPVIDGSDSQKPYDILLKICDMMEERYKLFSDSDCSKLKSYNEYRVQNNQEPLPVIVVVIDEYADLVESNKRISEPVVRLGQKARAAGIHMIIGTQRPSVDVLTGVIKANVPSRVALLSSSAVNSAIIVDQGGAEKLIGNGDMLVKCASLSNTQLIRCQGAFVSDQEIKAVCDYLRVNYGDEYNEDLMEVFNRVTIEDASLSEAPKESRFGSDEEKFQAVKNWAMSEEYISMSKIQTTFGIGFNRASRIFKRLQREGVVSDDPATNSSKGSKVLIHNYTETNSEYNGSIEQTTVKKL